MFEENWPQAVATVAFMIVIGLLVWLDPSDHRYDECIKQNMEWVNDNCVSPDNKP